MKPLEGKTVLVPESRELDLFAGMLEAQGALTVRCPMVTITDPGDTSTVAAWIGRLIAGDFDDVILQTGEGLRRLLAIAGVSRDAMIAALGKLRIVVRGPKPVKALREIGLRPCLTAEEPTSAGLAAILSREPLSGRRIGLQSYPDAPSTLPDFLTSRGAAVDVVVPYAYASDAEDGRVLHIIDLMAAGQIHVAAFTSSPQIRRLSEVAHKYGRDEDLSSGLAHTAIAAVGPVVVDALTTIGLTPTIVPAESFHLKPMVLEIVKHFEQK